MDMFNFKVVGQDALRCFTTKTPEGKDKYLDPMSWKDMMFCSKARGWSPVDFDQLVQHFKDTQTLVDQY